MQLDLDHSYVCGAFQINISDGITTWRPVLSGSPHENVSPSFLIIYMFTRAVIAL